MGKGKGKFLKGFLVGSALGTVLGMMFAPKSGREFREDLSDETDRFVNKAKSEFHDAKAAAVNSYETSRERFKGSEPETAQEQQDPVDSTAGHMASEPKIKVESTQGTAAAETPEKAEPEKKPKRRGRPPKKKTEA